MSGRSSTTKEEPTRSGPPPSLLGVIGSASQDDQATDPTTGLRSVSPATATVAEGDAINVGVSITLYFHKQNNNPWNLTTKSNNPWNLTTKSNNPWNLTTKSNNPRNLTTKSNEWYPQGIQISLHIWSPGLQAYGGGEEGYSRVNFGHLKYEVFHWGSILE